MCLFVCLPTSDVICLFSRGRSAQLDCSVNIVYRFYFSRTFLLFGWFVIPVSVIISNVYRIETVPVGFIVI